MTMLTRGDTVVGGQEPQKYTAESVDFQLLEFLRPYLAHCLTLNHDLNNPLAGILGYAEFIVDEKDNLSEDQIYFIEQIQKCAERIRNHVEQLANEKASLGNKVDLKSLLELCREKEPIIP